MTPHSQLRVTFLLTRGAVGRDGEALVKHTTSSHNTCQSKHHRSSDLSSHPHTHTAPGHGRPGDLPTPTRARPGGAAHCMNHPTHKHTPHYHTITVRLPPFLSCQSQYIRLLATVVIPQPRRPLAEATLTLTYPRAAPPSLRQSLRLLAPRGTHS